MIGPVPPRVRPELVGRLEELERVADALGQHEGGGGAVLLGGDAGIGKSALVGRLVERSQGHRVLVGHCVGEVGTSLPYLPFVEMFAGLDARERDLVDELVATHPGLVPLVPRLAGAARADTVRGDLVEAVHAALTELGRRGPVLAVVEDVHWADESTRELLTLLFTRGGPPGVGLLVTWRSDDIHRRHPLAGALALWSRLPSLTRLELGPLPDADVRLIVRRVSTGLAPRVVEEVARRAEGNAFFAEELAAAAGTGGVDPGDLTRLLLARVDQLDDDAQSVVRVAAVIGRRVPHTLLERVAAVDPTVLRRALRAALEHHVLEPWGDRGYEFRHALLAEAVSDDLLPHERVQLHRACADALLEDATLGTDADLARHALASGDRALALTAAVRAGDSARRMGGPAEALAHYEAALGLLDVEAAQTHGITLRAAAAANATGRPMRAMTLLRARLAGTAPSRSERAELLGALTFASRMTEERVDRLALTAEALDLLDDAPAPLRVGLLTRRAEALTDAGETAEAVAVADEAMALAVRHDLTIDRADLSSVLVRLGEAAGDPGESVRRLEAVVAEWTDAPDLALLRAMHVLASLHLRQGEYRAALDGFERAHAEARRAGLQASVFGVDGRAFAVTAAYEMGDWDLAVRLVEDASAAGLPAAGFAGIESAGSYVPAARGQADAESLLAATRPWWSEDGRLAVQSGSAAVDVLGREGRLGRMLEVHDELVAHLRDLWSLERVPVEVRLAALVVGHLGSALRDLPGEERRRLLEVARGLAADAASVWGEGSTLPAPSLEGVAWSARARAEALRVEWAAGSGVDAVALVAAWRQVVDLFEERAEPYELARSRARLAEVLTATGDPEAAAEQARLAREVAERLGARPLVEALDRLTTRPAATVLTAREQEVLALVAAGRSNGEVGRALFISTKTASVHVSNILAKLGAGSRGEAVALARAAGLLPD
jgi:DNA-binding NarL/FixJ family response regulator